MSATPLLDRLQPTSVNPPRRPRRFATGLLAGAAAGLLLGLARVDASVLLWLFPALVLAVIVHETGHLAAALLVRFEVRQFAAGPLVIARESRGVRFRFVPARILAGQVQAAPSSGGDLRRKFLLFSAGGPAATLAALLLTPLLPAGAFAVSLWIANLVCAAISLWPGYAGGVPSDGMCIQLLRRPSAGGELLAAVLYLLAQDARGIAPPDWDAAALAKLENPGPSPLAASAAILRITHAWHAEDPEVFAAAVERALALAPRMSPDLRRIAFDAAAWAQAFGRRNAPLGEAWLADARAIKGAIPTPDWDASTVASIAWAKGDAPSARAHLSRAVAALDRRPGVSGSVLACRRRFVSLLGSIDRDSATISSTHR